MKILFVCLGDDYRPELVAELENEGFVVRRCTIGNLAVTRQEFFPDCVVIDFAIGKNTVEIALEQWSSNTPIFAVLPEPELDWYDRFVQRFDDTWNVLKSITPLAQVISAKLAYLV